MSHLNLESTESEHHIPSLDGLRGLAILLILLYHCFPSLYKFGAGIAWIGVDLSFVLSGFLITCSLLSSDSLTTFFIHRTLRIAPTYFALLALFFILLPLFTGMDWLWSYSFYYLHQVWYWTLTSNWLIAAHDHWPNVGKPVLDHLWSIAAISQFYLFWAILVKSSNRRILPYISIGLVVASVALRNIFVSIGLSYTTSYVFTFARLDGLCLGALVALLMKENKTRSLLSKAAPKTLIVSSIGILATILISRSLSLKDDHFIRFGYLAVNLLFSSLLVYALSKNSFIQKALEYKTLKWLGKYSYAIYIYHWFLYQLVADKMNDLFHFLPQPLLAGIAGSCCSVGIILLVAFLNWHIIEKPFLHLRNRRAR